MNLHPHNLAKALLQALKDPETKDDIKQSIIYSHLKCQSYFMSQTIDLRDFCLILGNVLSPKQGKIYSLLTEQCRKVRESIDDCIIQCGFSGGKYQYSNGISVFFPWSFSDYTKFHYDYNSLKINYKKNFAWNNLLFEFLGKETLREPRKLLNPTTVRNTDLPGSTGVVEKDQWVYFTPVNPSVSFTFDDPI